MAICSQLNRAEQELCCLELLAVMDIAARTLLIQQREHANLSTHLAQHDYKTYAAVKHVEGDRAGRVIANLVRAEQ